MMVWLLWQNKAGNTNVSITSPPELFVGEIDTPHRSIIKGVVPLTYPLRRTCLTEPDNFRLLRHSKPTYIMGHFNAHFRLFGYRDTYAVERGPDSLISGNTDKYE